MPGTTPGATDAHAGEAHILGGLKLPGATTLRSAQLKATSAEEGEDVEGAVEERVRQIVAEAVAMYREENPFEWMELISLQGKTNFFEKRVPDYKKSCVGATASERERVLVTDAEF